MKYDVICSKEPPRPLDLDWDGRRWYAPMELDLKNFMGTRPSHFPRVEAKLAYGEEAIEVIFRVEDQYVLAVADRHQDMVCHDSCVEFFFTPGPDVESGYFNLEVNCGGTMLMHYQREPRKDATPLKDEHLADIDIIHSLPKQVHPEMAEPTIWLVTYRLPLSILESYFPTEIQMPSPGVTWHANFYKCADKSSHPHWLTWAPVQGPQPDFHQPRQFGTLVFQ